MSCECQLANHVDPYAEMTTRHRVASHNNTWFCKIYEWFDVGVHQYRILQPYAAVIAKTQNQQAMDWIQS